MNKDINISDLVDELLYPKKDLEEGLERAVDVSLKRKSFRTDEWWWDAGLNAKDEATAAKIMDALDADKGFGKTSYDKKTGKISFSKF